MENHAQTVLFLIQVLLRIVVWVPIFFWSLQTKYRLSVLQPPDPNSYIPNLGGIITLPGTKVESQSFCSKDQLCEPTLIGHLHTEHCSGRALGKEA